MSKIPKLKIPLWVEIVYFALVAVVPATIAALEIFQSHSSAFKITFSSIGIVLLVIIVIRRFVLKDKIKQLQERCIMLEHDYSNEIGKKENEEIQWYKFNLIIYIYHAIVMILCLVLAVLFITALSEQLIAFKGAAILIFASVLIALIFRIVTYIALIKQSSTAKEKNDEQQTG